MRSQPSNEDRHWQGWVAIILAITVGIALLMFTAAMVLDAFSASPGLSENATQVLTGAFSGIIGALAVYLGGRREPPRPPPEQPGSGKDG